VRQPAGKACPKGYAPGVGIIGGKGPRAGYGASPLAADNAPYVKLHLTTPTHGDVVHSMCAWRTQLMGAWGDAS